jgi:hypothetical protein
VAVTPDTDVSVKLSAPSSVKRGSNTIKVANLGPSNAGKVTLKWQS